MLDFSQLSPLMRDLHAETTKLYYLFLPVFFALAVVLQWFKRGQSVDYLELLKRTLISTLLLIAFPEITSAILSITEGVAQRIDSVQSFDKLLEIAQQKIDGYNNASTSILQPFNDMILGLCTFLSFLFVFVVRYITLALFHFFWLFLVVMAPLLLLFNIFAWTQDAVTNLFRGLIEVASWKIVWAIFGVMLSSLSFGKMYQLEGTFISVIVMNIVIALAMFATPLIVHGIVGRGVVSSAPMLTLSAAAIAAKVPLAAARVGSSASGLVKNGPSFSSRSNFPKTLTRKDGYEYHGKA